MRFFSIKKDVSPLLILAIPLVLTGIVQSAIFFFETLFLAHVSQEALAAGALVTWLFGTIAVIMFGILSAVNILVAHKHGANDQKGISLVVRDSFRLALLLFIPAFLLFWNMSPVFLLFGQPESIVVLAEDYLHALAWGLLPDFIMIVFLEFLIGLGHAKVVMNFTLLSVSLNIFFSYVFIFGKYGFPRLEIAGAGWGMTVSYWITVIAVTGYVLSRKCYQGYFNRVLSFTKPSYLLELFQIGVPMGAMYCIEVGFFFAVTLLMGNLNDQILAANQIALQYLGVLIAIVFSIAQAITVRMSHLLGAKDSQAAQRASYIGLCISTFFMCLIAIVYWFFPVWLIAIDFNVNDPANSELLFYSKQFLAVCAVFQIVEAIRISLFGALRGLKDTHFTLIVSIISFWFIAFPLGYLFAFPLSYGGVGLWWGMVIGAVCSVLLLQWRYKIKMRHYKGKATS